jgi:fumarylacetoacetate (FAA) hydrolase family protein
MLESVKKELKDRDFVTRARHVVERAIGEAWDGSPLEATVLRKSAAAVSRGRLGGLKGGKARAKKLSAKRRKTIALKAEKPAGRISRLSTCKSLI